MEAYKFETKIMKNGMIQIPTFEKYEDYEVEIFVVIKKRKKEKKKPNINLFFDKWEGTFSTVETDDIRYNEIMKKYK